jgi:DNA (cytosine-5)-methyltransferase 1
MSQEMHPIRAQLPTNGLKASPLPVISLFTGAGGLDLGTEINKDSELRQTGADRVYRVAVATDADESALDTYSSNFPDVPTIQRDIRELPTHELLEIAGVGKGEAALLIGGPPCTPFSKSGFWIEEKRNSSDPDASLLDEYVRVVADARPEGFVLENVQGLTYSTHRRQFNRLLESLRELGYNPQWSVLLAAAYGIPQLRRRVFVVGRRDGIPFRFPKPTHGGISEGTDSTSSDLKPFVTSRAALSGLKQASEQEEVADGEFGELLAEVPPGQNYLWHTERRGGRPLFKWRSRFWTFLLRLDPDRPSTTIQAQPGPWVGPFHWENVTTDEGELRARRLRVPEIMRLMTFPDHFQIRCGRSVQQKLLGNAVPVDLARTVIRSLAEQLGHMEPREPVTPQQTPLKLIKPV